jgi:sugar-specific transcriptional regulator TrmB
MNDRGGEAETALADFGFNQLEAQVYHALLTAAPATGYRLAQVLGRVPANIYQALKALLQKGAVTTEGGEGGEAVTYRPVPPDQLFAALRERYTRRAEAAEALLSTVHIPPTSEAVYQIHQAEQFWSQLSAMLARATETIVFDMVPPLYDRLREPIEAARARGVRIAGIAYRPEDVADLVPAKGERKGQVLDRWPGLGILLVVDAREQMVAQISRDMEVVLNAVYSDSPFLSCIMHGLMVADIRLVALRGDPACTPDPDHPLETMMLQAARPPGLRALLEQIGGLAGEPTGR